MTVKKIIAGATLAAVTAMAVPAVPAMANGAASTRNILLGAGLATYLIIQHNRKVHERYAEDARRQAASEQQANNAWAAYSAEKRAYDNQVAVNSDLKREIAYQHRVVVQQRQQLASAGVGYAAPPQHAVAYRGSHARVAKAPAGTQVAVVSYGWGQI